MKRLSLVLVCVLSFLCVLTPNATFAQSVNVNNFTIEDYQIDYYLDRNAEGRSTLKTVESITAQFPNFDQNHGIERAIPDSFNGHSTKLHIDSVVDQHNNPHHFTTYGSNDNTIVRIGDANTYVHGPITYKLTYSQQDVTNYYSSTGRDEFYWDTNGTAWQVPISSLSVRLHLPQTLIAARSNNQACYNGVSGSTEQCAITYADSTYSTTAQNLKPFQNVTIAVGFKPHTFSAYKMSLLEIMILIMLLIALISLPLAVILISWFLIRYHRRSNRLSELGTIVPEYIPPPDTSVSTAAAINRKAGRSFSAQLIDLAVRHYLRIYETRPKSLFRSANYSLEIIKDIHDLKAEEQELLNDIFASTDVGATLDMASLKNNYSVASKLQNNPKLLKKSIAGSYGLRARDDVQSRWFKRAGWMIFFISIISLSPILTIAAITSFICGAVLQPLTDKGLALSRYLKGLEMYIGVAEIERLQMLQSPEGAAKVGDSVDPKDPKQLIKLYERVLPYAILFGQEKDWNNRLGEYYQTANETPSWYTGSNNSVFNAAAFSTAMSNFNSAATYSNPSSSAYGGSGGGGSSGGGGGGGGGGGW